MLLVRKNEMIPRTVPAWQHHDWQDSLRNAIRDPAELCRLLDLPEEIASRAAAADFPVRVPHEFLARMRRGDPTDPLLRQVLPLDDEMQPQPGFGTDPIGEIKFNSAPGLIHKYRGRALLIVSGACAVNCRYCFRRHFPYNSNNLSPALRAGTLKAINDSLELSEIILSGGDPLSVSDTFLSSLVSDLADIPHLRRLRIHTRLPVVIPQRITDALVQILTTSRLKPVMVVHINHAAEIDASVTEALGRLHKAGIQLLNQCVLLRGINNNVDALAELSEKLFDSDILPYYLNVLDPVQGAAHFDVPDTEALALYDQLRQRLPGYLVPRLVRDGSDAPYKRLLLGN